MWYFADYQLNTPVLLATKDSTSIILFMPTASLTMYTEKSYHHVCQNQGTLKDRF